MALLAFEKFEDPVPKSIIKDVMLAPTESGVEQVINRMCHAGLVKRTNGAGPGPVGLYQLTAKGRKVAKAL
jgi:DNA-binding PadR family transcriptional regulator